MHSRKKDKKRNILIYHEYGEEGFAAGGALKDGGGRRRREELLEETVEEERWWWWWEENGGGCGDSDLTDLRNKEIIFINYKLERKLCLYLGVPKLLSRILWISDFRSIELKTARINLAQKCMQFYFVLFSKYLVSMSWSHEYMSHRPSFPRVSISLANFKNIFYQGKL